jgi:glutamyl-tRNA synthetase
MHIGNARVAIFNWLFARKQGGLFMFRLDDTDKSRSTDQYVDAIFKDLEWLELNYDIFAKQSERVDRYTQAMQFLIQTGRLYPCFETAEELEWKRKVQLKQNQPPVYDRSSLNLSKEQIDSLQEQGRKPHWRFLLKDEPAVWNDMIKGEITVQTRGSLSDPVLVKEDGTFLYTLSSVVDDFDFNITHIIRGEDHVTNTAVQIQLFEALRGLPPFEFEEATIARSFGEKPLFQCKTANQCGKPTNQQTCGDSEYTQPPKESTSQQTCGDCVCPKFAHLSLLLDKDGQPLSKRINSFCLQHLQESGIEGMAINCFLTGLGSSKPPIVTYDMLELVEYFDLNNIRGGARVAIEEINNTQSKLLHIKPFTEAKKLFGKLAVEFTEQEWNVIREDLTEMSDVIIWHNILHNETYGSTVEEHSELAQESLFLVEAERLLPNPPFDEGTWDKWLGRIKIATKRSGRALIHPIRLALTRKENGPEMRKLLQIMEARIVKARLIGYNDCDLQTNTEGA